MSALDKTIDKRGGLIFYDTGPTAPTASEVRLRVADILREAWGVNIDLATERPQGQICDSWTMTVFDKNNQLIYLVEQWDPQTAEGRYQDNICKIYFISRHPAIPTRVSCEVIGLPFTTIPAGSLAQDAAGRQFAAEADIVIPATGTTVGVFACTTPGPVIVDKETVNQIVTSVAGWDTINNSRKGIPGTYEESRQALERRRYDSVAKNGHGNVSSVWGAISNLDNVISVQIAENVKNVDEIIRGVLVHGHSLFISVVGGADQEIARTIYERKDGGCGYDGNTPIVIEIPTYNNIALQKKTIVINRPQMVRCAVKVQIATTENTPGNIDELIKDALQQNWAGLTDEFPRVEIGDTLLASRFYCAVSHIDARMFDLVRIRVGRVPESGGTIDWGEAVGFTLDEYPSLDNADVYIVEGEDLDDIGTQGQFFSYKDGMVTLNSHVIQPFLEDPMFSADDESGIVSLEPKEDTENE